MEVLITGLNTYLGRRAISHLSSDEFHVTGIVRNLKLFNTRLKENQTAKLYEIDLLKTGVSYDDFSLKNLKLGLYFTQVPQLNDQINMQLELVSLRNFIKLCKSNACNRIIYLARLMDSIYIDSIRTIFEEFRIQYTIVLKSSAIGRGTMLSDLFEKLSKNKAVPYWRFVGNLNFKPIPLLDVYRWIREMPWENNFISEVLYLGGDQSFNYKELFSFYMQAYHPNCVYSSFPLNKWMTKLILSRFYGIHRESLDEFRRVMKYESIVDNTTWSNKLSFSFTPMIQSLQQDQ